LHDSKTFKRVTFPESLCGNNANLRKLRRDRLRRYGDTAYVAICNRFGAGPYHAVQALMAMTWPRSSGHTTGPAVRSAHHTRMSPRE
jgi:hypothetical protein